MAKLQLSLLAVALMAVSASAMLKNSCTWAVGKYPFDEEKMAGTWNVIACAGNKRDEEVKKCAKFDVGYFKNKEESQYNVKYSAKDKDGKEVVREGFSKPYRPDRGSMMLGVMKKSGSEEYYEVAKQAIIATDYDNYAVFLECRPTFNAATKEFGRSYMASVLSRKTTLNEDVKKTLINLLSGYDIEESEFKMIDHTGCSA